MTASSHYDVDSHRGSCWLKDQLVDERLEVSAAGYGPGGCNLGRVESGPRCFDRVGTPADRPSDSGPGQASTLYAQGLATGGLALTGQPVGLLTSGAAWEQPLIENPALITTGQSYGLFYSGGWWDSAGYATCDTPLEPCVRTTVDAPLLATTDDQAGPGGASEVAGPAGDRWLAYHAWTAGAVGYDSGGSRTLRFASLT